jgi:ribA/ribD-fused uncharacterized protein
MSNLEIIKFYKLADPYGLFSNFKKSRMFVYNHWWNNVEAAYQAMKCVKPEDFTAIWKASSPREARELGQKVQLVPHWEDIKVDIMTECVMAKFLQNHEFLEQLLATGTAELIEDSPVDSFWGCGKDGKGKNHLGKILMQVREKLKGYRG